MVFINSTEDATKSTNLISITITITITPFKRVAYKRKNAVNPFRRKINTVIAPSAMQNDVRLVSY